MNSEPRKIEHVGVLVGIVAISMSTILLEITLTKFLSFRLMHHLTFAVLSMVILSFGIAGILAFTNPRLFRLSSEDPWGVIGNFAAAYAILTAIVLPFTCWWPLSPFDMGQSELMRVMAVPILFVFYAVPFFLAGICISQTFTFTKRSVPVIYFWDLLGAAVSAAACTWLLINLSGYGVVAVCAALGLISAIGYWCASGALRKPSSAVALVLGVLAMIGCVMYPSWAMKTYGIDIRAYKEVGPHLMIHDFNGIGWTTWNPIARVDVSNDGDSKHPFYRWGMPDYMEKRDLPGRYILMDGGASTRQIKVNGSLYDQKWLGDSVQAAPYVAKGAVDKVVIVGGGGGIDVLEAKLQHAKEVNVAELNSTTASLISGKFDPKNEYYPWLKTDENTTVNVFNEEGRHFAATRPAHSFDVMVASGVDTHTAVASGGMSLVENYLYTVDSVRDFARLLKPDGVISLVHWRSSYPLTATRMLLTYVAYLDSIGVKEPWKHLMVVASKDSDNVMLKMSPWTEDELNRVRNWTKTSGMTILFDPDSRENSVTKEDPSEKQYWDLAFMDPQARAQAYRADELIPPPVTDDSPYFYSFKRAFTGRMTSAQPTSLIMCTVAACLMFLFIPVFYAKRQPEPVPGSVLWFAVYFLLCGFGFLLYETAIIQMFSIFVGGPAYSLMVVLVAVLGGYSLGSWRAANATFTERTFMIAGIVLFALFMLLFVGLAPMISSLASLGVPGRLALAALVSASCSAVIGFTVAGAMEVTKIKYGKVVSWMWGVSCVANALGSISFITITQFSGIRSCLLIVAVLYLVANLMLFARLKKEPLPAQPAPL